MRTHPPHTAPSSPWGTNIFYRSPETPSLWRRVALSMWNRGGDPSVYGVLEVPVTPALNHIQALQQQTGTRITLTHFVGQVLAHTIAKHPEINSVIRWGKLYRRQTVDVFFIIAPDRAGRDLSGTVVRQAEHRSLEAIAQELHNSTHQLKTKQDSHFGAMKKLVDVFPWWSVPLLMKLTESVLYTFNRKFPLSGLPRDPFGSVILTSIGSLGLEFAFAPLIPFSRVPLMVAPGKVFQKLKLGSNGQVFAEETMRICVTFDHRIIDGVHASHLARTVTEYFENPQLLSAQN